MKDGILDKTDIDILRLLIGDSRSSYRQIAITIGLSTNAVKTRILRLISSGVIRQFFTTVNVAAFGFSKLCYLFIRNSKSIEETLSRIKLLGQMVVEVEGIGGTSLIGIAISRENEERIELLTEALKPALIQNIFVGQSSPLKLKMKKTDFRILKCLIADSRMEISEIAKQISVSSKTVSNRLEKLKQHRIVLFNVATDPLKMKGYIRCGMLVRLENHLSYKTPRLVQNMLEDQCLIALPMIHHDNVMSFQLVVNSIFDLDPAIRRIESLDGVMSAEVFVPQRARMHQDWIIREIDERVKTVEEPLRS
ncbi:MAG TPA: winged helix-turn-helix transcriptional regulator [Nitrososphaeraceae archaeon]